MPALANVIINDGLATPVAHTFKPINIDPQDVTHYNDTVSGIPIGFGRLNLSLRAPASSLSPGANSKSAVYRCRFKIEIPTLEVTSASTGSGIQPAPTVSHTTLFSGEFVLPARGTVQERKDILAYAKNFLSHALATSVVVDLENTY